MKVNFIILPLRSDIIQSKTHANNDNNNNSSNYISNDSIELKQYTVYIKTNLTFQEIKSRIINLIRENTLLGTPNDDHYQMIIFSYIH